MCNVATFTPGRRTYNYIRNFLSNRTAVIQLGDLQSDTIHFPTIGTPQGAVLSPLLFNIALIHLPSKLAAIPRLLHSIYADNITLWTTRGSDFQIEEVL